MSTAGGPPTARQTALLKEMGIDVWVTRGAELAAEPAVEVAALVAEPATEPTIETVSQAVAPAAADWDSLNRRIRSCEQCVLHSTRTQAVCGVGNTQADWLVIGEAPGADEDRQGEPFVGRAGQLLNEMLRAAGQPREQVFIANVLKCRPPDNRDPRPEEIEQCLPFLQEQIQRIQPKLILVVGRIAAQTLLNVKTPIGKLRGRVHEYGDSGIPMVITYHPAYLLRSPLEKRKSWQDLRMAMDVLRGEVAAGGTA